MGSYISSKKKNLLHVRYVMYSSLFLSINYLFIAKKRQKGQSNGDPFYIDVVMIVLLASNVEILRCRLMMVAE